MCVENIYKLYHERLMDHPWHYFINKAKGDAWSDYVFVHVKYELDFVSYMSCNAWGKV